MAKAAKSTLLLHPRTSRLVDLYISNPSQPLLITGPPGAGKGSLGRTISALVLDIPTDKLDGYPSFSLEQLPESQAEISIDAIRQIRRSLSLKSPTLAPRRVVMVDGAHQMSHEAQNALLKILEEPPAGAHFVLTATSASDLLPTVTSRAQELPVYPVSKPLATRHYSPPYDVSDVERAWNLSAGSAGLLSAILAGDQTHPLKLAVEEAKQFLTSNTYERLLMADELAGNKERFALFLDALSRTLRYLSENAVREKSKRLPLLLKSRKLVKRLSQQLAHRTNARLLGLELALKLRA